MYNKILGIVLIGIIITPVISYAVPSLQLYLDPTKNPGAYYNSNLESWVASNNTGNVTLTLLLKKSYWDSIKGSILVNGNGQVIGGMSIALALALETGVLPSAGSIKVEGNNINNFVYGIPPYPNYGDLPTHGVFPTYYTQYDVTQLFYNLARANQVTTIYDNVGGGSTKGYRLDLSISISGFEHIHFDLYSINASGTEIHKFAPFSHDAEFYTQNVAPPVPEPRTLILISTGLLVVVKIAKRKNKVIS